MIFVIQKVIEKSYKITLLKMNIVNYFKQTG